MAYSPFRNIGLKFLSICIAALLWLVVAGDRVVERAIRVPIEFQNLPQGLEFVGDPLESVDVRLYTVIYNAIADVKAAMEGLLEPTLKERVLGRAEVRKIFQIPKAGVIAGAYVTDGLVSRNSAGVRVLRDQAVVYQGKLGSLKRFKDDVREVQTGYECGIGVENFNDLKEGDVLEVYTIDKIAAKLE